MNKRLNLTEGSISQKLIKLSLPIMGTSFIQMAYNMIDMIWVGKDGSNAVAAVGTAGFYPWLAMSLIMISKIGGEIKVAQSIGNKDIKMTKSYIKASIELNIIFAVIYTIFILILNKPLIDIFNLGDKEVILMSRKYLITIGIGMFFYFINPVLTSIFNGLGNSKAPFKINTIGLIVNIALDPILIFGFYKLPALGVIGAALATVIAQVVVTICFVYMIIKNKDDLFNIRLFKNIEVNRYRVLLKLGMPVALQSGLFTLFSMALGIIVASFGPLAVATQKVGSQIESVSWMISDGLAAALSSFIGQNYGAGKYDRVDKGCKIGIFSAIIWGVFTSCTLIFFSRPIYSIFINEPLAIEKGADYLKILGYSQVFMCIEIIISGIFKGVNRTYTPSIIGILFTGLRIPLAMILCSPVILGLNGIWWSVTISSVIKGIILFSIFVILYNRKKLYKRYEAM